MPNFLDTLAPDDPSKVSTSPNYLDIIEQGLSAQEAESLRQSLQKPKQYQYQTDPRFPHGSSPEYQNLLKKASEVGLDGLTKDERRRVEAGIEAGFVRPEQIEGSSVNPAMQANMHAVLDSIRENMSQGWKPEFEHKWKEYTQAAQDAAGKVDEFMSQRSQNLPNAALWKKMTGKTPLESLESAFQTIGLEPDTAESDTITIPGVTTADGKPVTRVVENPVGRRIAENLVVGAVRFLPELAAGLATDPYATAKGFVSFPYEQVGLIRDALRFGDIADEDVEKARKELVKNPIGLFFLGSMGLHLYAKGAGYRTISENKLAESGKAAQERDAAIEKIDELRTRVEDEEALRRDIEKQAQEQGVKVQAQKRAVETETEQTLSAEERAAGMNRVQLMDELVSQTRTAGEAPTPAEIAAMTLPELRKAVAGKRVKPERGAPNLAPAELQARAARAREQLRPNDQAVADKVIQPESLTDEQLAMAYESLAQLRSKQTGLLKEAVVRNTVGKVKNYKPPEPEVAKPVEETPAEKGQAVLDLEREGAQILDVGEQARVETEVKNAGLDLDGERQLRQKVNEQKATGRPITQKRIQTIALDIKADQARSEAIGEEITPSAGVEKAPVSQAELIVAGKNINRLQDDVSRLEGIVTAFEEAQKNAAPDRPKKETAELDALIFGQKKNLADTQAKLADAEQTWADMKTRPVLKEEPTPPVEQPGPLAVEDTPQGAEPVNEPSIPESRGRVNTGNAPVDAARNLAHAKADIGVAEQVMRDSKDPERVRRAEADLVRYKAELPKRQAEYDRIQAEMENPAEPKPENVPEEPIPETVSRETAEQPSGPTRFASKSKWDLKPVAEINIDLNRFQGREEEFSQKTVDRVKAEFDPEDMRELHVWLDPKDGKTYVLAGHSRLQAMKELGEKYVPVVYRNFTESEAIKWAQERSNRGETPEGIVPDIEVTRKMIKRGESRRTIGIRFGEDRVNQLINYAYLDPKGKFIELLPQETAQEGVMPKFRMWARTVGELRKEFPKLTGRHEDQIFKALSENDGTKARAWQKADLTDIIQDQITDPTWKPDNPLAFDRKSRRMLAEEGRRRNDTKPVMAQIDELQTKIDQIGTDIIDGKVTDLDAARGLIKNYEAEQAKLRETLSHIINTQTDLQLNMNLSPQQIADAAIGLYKEGKQLADWAKTQYDKSMKYLRENVVRPTGTTREMQENLFEHRIAIRTLKVNRLVLGKQFERENIPKAIQPQFLHAVEEGSESKAYKGLSPELQEKADKWRQVAREHEEANVATGIVGKKVDREPNQVYLHHNYVNEKTGERFETSYGEFTTGAPQLREAKYRTYQEAEGFGLKPATYNVGDLIGAGSEGVGRAAEGRLVIRDLSTTQIPGDFEIQVAQGQHKTTRPAMMVELWSDIANNGLTKEYTLDNDRFLSKPIYVTDRNGRTRILEGRVGVHNSVKPFWDAYYKRPSFGGVAKLALASKSLIMMGIFHPEQIAINDMMMGRNPATDLIKGHRLMKEIDANPDVQLAYKMGFDGKITDLDFDVVDVLGLNKNKPWWKQPVKTAMVPASFFANLTFHGYIPRIKLAFTVDTFNAMLVDGLKDGFSRDEIMRQSVKMADNLFSGGDSKLAALETSRIMARIYYGAQAASFWHSFLISPTWQMAHIRAFEQSMRSAIPDLARRKIGLQENLPIADSYRRYLLGATTLYGLYSLYNYYATKKMDGEGRFPWDDSEGGAFHVRALWNDPDGRKVYLHMAKTMTEVPEMIQSTVKGDFQKFANKIHPLWDALAQQIMNTDDFGNKKYEAGERTIGKMAKDMLSDAVLPMSARQIVEAADKHKGWKSIVSGTLFAHPASKGYPGGEFGKMMDTKDWWLDPSGEKRSISERTDLQKSVDDLIVEGNLLQAVQVMVVGLGYDDTAVRNRIMKFQSPLLKKFRDMRDDEATYFFYRVLTPEQQQKFYEALIKEANR